MTNAENLSPERELAIRQAFREELEFATGPTLEGATTDYQSAMKFAETAIKGGFLLNGGALIGLPAFVAFLRIDPTVRLMPIAWALVAFTVGVAFAWMTSFFGYFAARRSEVSKLATYEATRLHYTLVWDQSPDDPPTMDQVNEQRAIAKGQMARSAVLSNTAVVFGVLSVLAFIVGATVSAWFLLTRAGAL